MYFHLWTKGPLDLWKMRMIISYSDGSNRKIVTENDLVSHYTWIDDDRLLFTKETCGTFNYCIYNALTNKTVEIESNLINNDGHPTMITNNLFISDTYPLEHCMQKLFLFDIKTKRCTTILEAFSDPRLYIEKRCDMHPRINRKNKLINIDSSFRNGIRSIILINLKGEKIYDI